MLRWRLILGIPLVGLLVGVGWLDAHARRPGSYLAPVAILIAALAADELIRMFAARGRTLSRASIQLAAVLPVVFCSIPLAWEIYPERLPVDRIGWLGLGLIAALAVVLVAEMGRFGEAKDPTINAGLGCFAVLYVGGLVGMLLQLRWTSPGGLTAVLSLIAVVKLSDIGQYFAGRTWGRHRLAPQLSPGKTWEGFAGGMAMAVVAAAALSPWLGPLTLPRVLSCLAMAAAGVGGDLAESLLKRDAGVKDSSNWMPGFGGILDLIDSLLMAGPVAYVCWSAGWMQSGMPLD